MLDAQTLGSGFADPVFQSQAVFRSIMDAMARPGTIHSVSCCDPSPPAPLTATAAAVALSLCDLDTPVWCDPPLAAAPGVAEWLTFHTGASVAAEPKRAAFSLISESATLPDFGRFSLGTDEYPDRSTTLIVQVNDFSHSDRLILSGPGIEGSQNFAPSPLPPDFVERWAANGGLFPRGVDLVFCSQTQVAALPRSTRIEPQAKN